MNGEKTDISTHEIVKNVFNKGLSCSKIDFYAGTQMMHGMSEYALITKDEIILNKVIGLFQKFGTGEIKATGNFISYEAGGSGAAYLSWKEVASSLDVQVIDAADRMMKHQKRLSNKLMTSKHVKMELEQVFIDVAFAVSPYLLYAGLKLNNPGYIDFAVFETLEIFRILRDKDTKLLHQGIGFQGLGKISEDNWSRGNGWGAFALAILARDLPEDHPRKKEVINLAQQFFSAAIRFQNNEGLWHQEITDPTSFVEVSGSGMILYGLGIMLEQKILDESYMENYRLGLRGLTSYVGSDGSVSHTCIGCLCPGMGTKNDYRKHPWAYNDAHSFGPVVLAYTQAIKLGIDRIRPLRKLGYYSIVDSPDVPRTYVVYARDIDVAWENDRIAFRVFNQTVRDKVGSGIDIWTKSVNYPVLDKWYKQNEQGQPYHVDRGEGCDFYDMGKRRGCGGIAIWMDGKPYVSETYNSHRISRNQPDKVTFTLNYNNWQIPDLKIQESRIVEMVNGTNLVKMQSTIKSVQDMDLVVSIGLTYYNRPKVLKNKDKGILSVWEQVDPKQGKLGTGVVVDPDKIVGFETYDGDEYVLIKVKTNTPFVYYVGAGWSKSAFFNNENDWQKYLLMEANKVKF
jgi:rhamnogalacturonyl hydrolase YesR